MSIASIATDLDKKRVGEALCESEYALAYWRNVVSGAVGEDAATALTREWIRGQAHIDAAVLVAQQSFQRTVTYAFPNGIGPGRLAIAHEFDPEAARAEIAAQDSQWNAGLAGFACADREKQFYIVKRAFQLLDMAIDLMPGATETDDVGVVEIERANWLTSVKGLHEMVK